MVRTPNMYDAMKKAEKILRSCTTFSQLDVADNVLHNFYILFEDEKNFDVVKNRLINTYWDVNTKIVDSAQDGKTPDTGPSTLKEIELVDNIMGEFNFNKVQNVMEHLRWDWLIKRTNGDTVFEIPSIDYLKQSAQNLLYRVIELAKEDNYSEPVYETECGGFRAEYYQPLSDGPVTLRLTFVLESWDENLD